MISDVKCVDERQCLLQISKCFSATDILEGQGLSTKKCFTQSSVGQLCSAIVDRLTRGESICEDEVFDDVSCVNDVVEQLFDLLSVDVDATTLTELRTFISDRLPFAHHRSVRAGDHGNQDHGDNKDQHDHDEDQNVNLCAYIYVCTYIHSYVAYICMYYTCAYMNYATS